MYKYITFLLSVFFLIVLFLLGGRGPLLAACLPFICLLFLKRQDQGLDQNIFFKVLKFVLFIMLIFMVANSFVNLRESVTIDRFSEFSEPGLGDSA
jgi:F0F1-type ATP synthase assembly protein I